MLSFFLGFVWHCKSSVCVFETSSDMVLLICASCLLVIQSTQFVSLLSRLSCIAVSFLAEGSLILRLRHGHVKSALIVSFEPPNICSVFVLCYTRNFCFRFLCVELWFCIGCGALYLWAFVTKHGYDYIKKIWHWSSNFVRAPWEPYSKL